MKNSDSSGFGGFLGGRKFIKKRIFAPILEKDIPLYLPGFPVEDYQATLNPNETDPEVLCNLQSLYRDILPVQMYAWFRAYYLCDECIPKNVLEQRDFIVNRVIPLFDTSLVESRTEPLIVADHTITDVVYPVYFFEAKQLGLKMCLSSDFFYWYVSVKSTTPLDYNFMGIVPPHNQLHSNKCGAIPNMFLYEPHSQNKSTFSFFIKKDDYLLFTWFFLLSKYIHTPTTV